MRRRPTAIVMALALLATSGAMPAAAAEPDVEPPWTILEQLPEHYPGPDVWVMFHVLWPEDGMTYECMLDGGPWTACASPWVLTGLTEARHDIAVRATDVAGNTDPTPEEASFILDMSGPVGSVVINGGAETVRRGLVNISGTATDASALSGITLSTDPSVDAEGRLNGNTWQVYWIEQGRQIAFDLTGGSAAPGPRTVYAQWVDVLGFHGPVTSDTVQFDPSTKAGASIRLDLVQGHVDIGEYMGYRAWAIADDGAPVRDGELRVAAPDMNGQAPNGSEASGFSYRLPAGTYTVQASYTGSAELEDVHISKTFTVGPDKDVVAPDTHMFGYPGTSGRPSDVTFTITGGDKSVRLECRLDGGSWATCVDGWHVQVGAGPHVAEARSIDLAGNVDPSPAREIWSSGPGPDHFVGSIDWEDPFYPINDNYVTTDKMGIKLSTEIADAVKVRISNSMAWDGTRLTKALELPWPAPAVIDWDLSDPAYGGYAGDGDKIVWAQWQDSDGIWSSPTRNWVVLDRAGPTLSIVANGGNPYLDDDEVMVYLRATDQQGMATRWVSVAGSAAELDSHRSHGQGAWFPFALDDAEIDAAGDRWVYAQTTDNAGNRSNVARAKIILDRSYPTAILKAPSFVVGSQVSTSKVAVRVAGTSKDTGSGLASNRLQEAKPGGAYKTVATSTTSSVASTRSLSPDSGRAYRIRAQDRIGHVRWVAGPELRPVRRSERSTFVTYSATGWKGVTAESAIGDRLMRSRTSGAAATFRFTGRAVGIIAPRSASRGRFAVYVDGAKVATVDLGRSGTQARTVVYAKSWSTARAHTVTVKVIKTTGRTKVDLDGFLVLP